MHSNGICQSGRGTVGCKHFISKICLVTLVLCVSFILVNPDAEAAQLSFDKKVISINAAPGQEVSVPVTVTLSDVLSQYPYASFSLSQVNGNLNRTWVFGSLFFSLNSWYMTRQNMLHIRVPKTAALGLYTGVFDTMGLRASEDIDPVSLVVNVNVDDLASCKQIPGFSEILSATDAIQTRNNKQVELDLSGSVTSEGCSIKTLQYQLVDEYGELDRTENVTFDDDGAFKVSIPMVASRRGNDKDGRLYTVCFIAENEVGVAKSSETRIVVMHDNRKE